MKIGITGNKGFLGSNLVNNLCKSHELELFDRKKHNLKDVKSLKTFVEDTDCIIHLAGVNRASNSELININSFGTFNLMEAIQKYGNNPKVIFSSSMQVYGLKNEFNFLDESFTLNPDNTYGLSKKIGEDIVKFFSYSNDIETIILRIANIFGPGCKPYYNSVIATFLHIIFNDNQNIMIDGSGNQARDFIYISDVVDAINLSINYTPKKSEVFNICTGKATTLNNLVEIISKVLNKDINISHNNLLKLDDFLVGCPDKACRCLGFKAKETIESGINSMVI